MIRDYIAIAAQYQADIIAGRIPACRWVKAACERNRRDLDRQDTAGFSYHFEPSKATEICRFGEMLPFVSGRGFSEVLGRDEYDRPVYKNFQLQPWQIWILCTLFGWMNERGLRRFRIALVLVPRKNGKSNLCAIIALYMLTQEGEPGAQVISAATTRDQAKMIADVVWEMASRSHAFREFYGVKLGSRTSHTLSVPMTASKFLPLSADANSLDGLNISCGLVDEFQNHKTAAVWDVIDTATSSRLQPLIIGIGTAGENFGGVCHAKLGYLEKVLDQTAHDETLFGLNYTIDAEDDWRLPASAVKANPNYGISVDPHDLARKVNLAEQSPDALDTLLVKHLNVWLRAESAWMSGSIWQTCARAEWEKLNAAERYAAAIHAWKGYPCWIGVDLGEVRDPSAITLVFKLSADTYGIIPRIYWPADGIAKSPIAILSGMARDGWIIVTPGNEADYSRIRSDLVELFNLLDVKEIDFDKKSARLMMQDIRALLEPKLGRDKVQQVVLDIPQSVETMDPAMKTTEGLVLGKRLQHDGNPVMAWMISNVVIERNLKGEIYPRKAGGKDSANKIDGPVSMWTALSQARVTAVAPQYQVFVIGGKKS